MPFIVAAIEGLGALVEGIEGGLFVAVLAGLDGGSIDFREVVKGVPVREDRPDDVPEASCFVGDLLGD